MAYNIFELIENAEITVQEAALQLDIESQLRNVDRKNNGVTYTPFEVAYKIVELANPKPFENWMDSSTGRGMFIWATLAYLENQGHPSTSIQQFLDKHLHAIELDTQACDDTRKLLAAWCTSKKLVPPTRAWLQNGDSLLANVPRMDVMVGNPPYVRIQHLEKKVRETLRQQYNTCAQGNVDLYYAFFEQALCTARRGAFIAPNSWLTNISASNLRRMLATRTVKVIDFYDTLIFAPVRAYTAVWQWDDHTKCLPTIERQDGWSGSSISQSRTTVQSLMGAPWPDPLRTSTPLNKTTTQPLHALADIYSGIATLADKVYTVRLDQYDTITQLWTAKTKDGNVHKIEAGILVPLYKWTKDNSAGILAKGSRAIIYPYDASGTIISEVDIQRLYPMAYKYLVTQRNVLAKRDKGTGKYETWFAYGRKQGLYQKSTHAFGVSTMWTQACSLIPIAQPTSPFAFVSGFVIIPKPGTDIARLEKGLQDPDVWDQVKAKGKIWAGGKPYRTIGAPLLRSLQIPY